MPIGKEQTGPIRESLGKFEGIKSLLIWMDREKRGDQEKRRRTRGGDKRRLTSRKVVKEGPTEGMRRQRRGKHGRRQKC